MSRYISSTPAILTLLVLAIYSALPGPALGYRNSYNYGYNYGVKTNNLLPIAIAGDSCVPLPFRYEYRYYSYQASISGAISLPTNCTADLINVSNFFVDGTCIKNNYNNEKQGCSNSTQITATNTKASCAAVYSDTTKYKTLSSIENGKVFNDAYNLCANAYTGYFYVENNCPSDSGEAEFTILMEYTAWSNSCSDSSWPTWATITIAVCCIVFAVALMGCVCMKKRRAMRPPQMMAPVSNVQMGGMPYNNAGGGVPPPYSQYNGGGGGGGMATGYPAAGPPYPETSGEYGGKPYGGGGYGGAPPPSGYPPPAGYPAM
jgi:hypothetical protein